MARSCFDVTPWCSQQGLSIASEGHHKHIMRSLLELRHSSPSFFHCHPFRLLPPLLHLVPSTFAAPVVRGHCSDTSAMPAFWEGIEKPQVRSKAPVLVQKGRMTVASSEQEGSDPHPDQERACTGTDGNKTRVE